PEIYSTLMSASANFPDPYSALVERARHDGHNDFEVAARCELGDDAAVRRVDGVLGRHHAGTNTAAVLEDGRRSLVAGALDPEDDHRAERGKLSGPWSASPSTRPSPPSRGRSCDRPSPAWS